MEEGSGVVGEQASVKAIAERVTSLEARVCSLETNVDRRGSGPGRFWYILTFASWMMVPLVVVYLFHFRKNSH